jgi:hypothetical protein
LIDPGVPRAVEPLGYYYFMDYAILITVRVTQLSKIVSKFDP